MTVLRGAVVSLVDLAAGADTVVAINERHELRRHAVPEGRPVVVRPLHAVDVRLRACAGQEGHRVAGPEPMRDREDGSRAALPHRAVGTLDRPLDPLFVREPEQMPNCLGLVVVPDKDVIAHATPR